LAYSTEIEGFIAETINERFGELDRIRDIFREMKTDAEKLKEDLLLEVGKPNIEDLKKNIIAVDGSNYQEQYESIAITIATAYVYLNNKQMERYLPNIKVVPPYYSSLVNSLRMKNLEYKVATEVLYELENQVEGIDLILLDGAITFPDEALANHVDNVPWVKEAYDEHREIVNNFFNLVIEKKIPTIAISKDSMANKYFLSLFQALTKSKNDNEFDQSFLEKNKEFIEKWGVDGSYNVISENSMLKMIFGDQEYCRTKYAEITCCLRNEIPTKALRGRVMGFYIKNIYSEKPFFVEAPMQFKNELDNISQILSSISYYSLRPGYPFPLYVAHKKVEMKKKYSKNLARILRNIARKDLKNDYGLLFTDKFREKM